MGRVGRGKQDQRRRLPSLFRVVCRACAARAAHAAAAAQGGAPAARRFGGLRERPRPRPVPVPVPVPLPLPFSIRAPRA